jgi:hypothetical protein
MIHQPHFLPWPGYIARCLAADAFVVLDNVQFKRNHFQQRTQYVDLENEKRWLSLPIAKPVQSAMISEVKIVEPFMLKAWQRPLKHVYGQTENFEVVWGEICELLRREAPMLLAMTRATLAYQLSAISAALGHVAPAIVMGSSINTSDERTQRLIDICHARQFTHLIMGRDAVTSHDCEQLTESGVDLVEHVYRGPPDRAPRPGVTILHDLFRLGLDETATRVASDWGLRPLHG